MENSKGYNAVIRGYYLQRHFSGNRNGQLKEKRQKYSKKIALNMQQQQLNELLLSNGVLICERESILC